MADFNAGTARAQYIVDASQAKAELKALAAGHQALSPVTAATAAAMSREALAAGDLARALQLQDVALGKATAKQQQGTAETLKAARAEAALAVSYGRHREAIEGLEKELGQQATRTIAVINAEKQLVTIENQLAAATKKRADVKPPAQPAQQSQGLSFAQATAAFGLGTFGPQLVGRAIGAAVQAGGEALELRETQNALKAVAGDTKTYATIMSEARKQQLLFGGSLQENIEGLSGLAVTSRNTGASLNQLVDIQKRLTVLNPAQGAQGGLIALNEALAGNVSSLQRRFNIPRSALKELNDTSKPVAERLAVIDKFLSGVGITSESVAGKVDQSALAFRGLSAELDTLKTRGGGALADLFAPAAEGLSRLIGLVNSNPEAIAKLRALGKGQITDADVEAVRREQRGSAISEAISGAGRTGQEVIDPLSGALSSSDEGNRLAAALAPLHDRLVEVGSASDTSAAAIQDLVRGLADGRVHTEQLASVLGAIADRERGVTDIEDQRAQALAKLKSATDDTSDSIAAQVLKAEAARAKSEELTNAQSNLAGIGSAVHDGLITSGEGASLLAIALQIPIDKANELLGKLAQLAGAQDIAKSITASIDRNIARAGVTGIGKKDIDVFGLPTQKDVQQSQQIIADANVAGQKKQQQLAQQQQQAQQLRSAQFQKDLAAAKDATAQIGIVRKKLAETTDPVERLNLETQIIQLQKQADAASDKAGHSRISAGEKALNLEERIRDSKEKQYKATLDVQKLTAQDTLDRLKEQKELNVANRILGSGRASADLKTAAGARASLIDADQQLRQLDIAEKTLTAGGTIINGRVFQSRQGGGGAPAGAAGGPVPSGPGAAAPGGAGGGATVNLVLLDSAGAVIAKTVEPIIMDALLAGIQHVALTRGLGA